MNIFLISIDDLRYDCMSSSANPIAGAKTPTLDSLAAKGVSYPRCYSTSSYTPASHMSMFTGLYPNMHKVKTFFSTYDGRYKTLADIMKSAGFSTSAWVEHHTFKTQKMLPGFDTILEPMENDRLDLFDFIHSFNPAEDNFIFLHFFDVHKPYFLAKGGEERWKYNIDYDPAIRDICERNNISYDSLDIAAEAELVKLDIRKFSESLKEIAKYRALDFQLRNALRERGVLFDEIIPLYVRGVNKFDRGKFRELIHELWDFDVDSKIVITSDHGESRCWYNGVEDFWNQPNVLDTSIHVPLIMVNCGATLTEDAVSLVDIVPTLLEEINIPLHIMQGTSLRAPIARPVFAESWDYSRSMLGTFAEIHDQKKTKEEFLAEACAIYGNNKCTLSGSGRDTQLCADLKNYLD